MTMPSPEWLTAFGVLVVTVLAAIASQRTSRFTARKDEIGLLREEITMYSKRIRRAIRRINALERKNAVLVEYLGHVREHNMTLRLLLIRAGIKDAPEMPTLPPAVLTTAQSEEDMADDEDNGDGENDTETT